MYLYTQETDVRVAAACITEICKVGWRKLNTDAIDSD